jgi:inorganic pyrophosphatase
VCVVEISKGTRNKHEYDPELGGIKFDRLLTSAATYPADYGYPRGTLSERPARHARVRVRAVGRRPVETSERTRAEGT